MSKTKIRSLISICYLLAISFLLLVPRSNSQSVLHQDKISRTISNNLAANQESIYDKIIYLHGAIEKIGNLTIFFLLFFVLSYLLPKLKSSLIAVICCLISVSAETLQIFIPGRVSSIIDFFTNAIGVGTAFALTIIFPNIRNWMRGGISKKDSRVLRESLPHQ